MSNQGSSASHSVAFRVMRLCRPSFNVDPPLRIDPDDLFFGEDYFDDPSAPSSADLITPDSDPRSHHHPLVGMFGEMVFAGVFGNSANSYQQA
ncbi:hypothetical protein TSUD_247270 [Trifolium subterraneum]|uniref:Uncharacterized protein n=1 Tax=Trifolium subterraneum TaxID=3900 RepID=A0A2Z6PKK9_TRISU|nr:hypothetical protein TSUD_247270 [Trifolium subterraneum]